MRWFCCCRRADTKQTCPKPTKQKAGHQPRKSYAGEQLPKKSVSFSDSVPEERLDDVYEEIRKYDQRQIQLAESNNPPEDSQKNVHLSVKIYYPPSDRRYSRIPLEQQRAEASRFQTLHQESTRGRRQSLLETSRDVGEGMRRQSVQKQNLYELLKKEPT